MKLLPSTVKFNSIINPSFLSSIHSFIHSKKSVCVKMGIPSELRDVWVSKRKAFLIPSPDEQSKVLRTKQCTNEGVRAGFKAASIACVATAVPTLAAVRMIPWAKANLNYTAQALIISAASIAAYFITADKTILECARKNARLEDSLRHNRDVTSS